MQKKSHQDFVTAADIAVERLLRNQLSELFPEDGILGEEQGGEVSENSIWVIDPIDGTSNFMHGLPDWAVSIGFCQNGRIECAVVNAPDLDLLGTAQAGHGMRLNGHRVKVSPCAVPGESLVLLGRSSRHGGENYPRQVQRLIESGIEYRRNGSAAYSLLSVAVGRVEAFFEAHLNSWDAIAGILLVEEAGGEVDFPALAEFLVRGGAVLASNSKLHDAARSAIKV